MFAQGQQNSHIIHMACDEMANKNKQMAFEKKKQQQPMRAQTKYADGWKKQKKKKRAHRWSGFSGMKSKFLKAATKLSSHDLYAPMDQLLFLPSPLAAIH